MNKRIADSTKTEGHFFLMPEDNLVSLLEGNETVQGPDGKEEAVEVSGLEMIYPTEGSVLNSNPAAIVDAGWVSEDELDAANRWIDYLREDDQQRAFMGAGFRPGTDLEIDPEQFEKWGLDAEPPITEIDPGQLDPEVLKQIIGSWGAVKKPSVVTFVVDIVPVDGRKRRDRAGAGGPSRHRRRDAQGGSRLQPDRTRDIQRRDPSEDPPGPPGRCEGRHRPGHHQHERRRPHRPLRRAKLAIQYTDSADGAADDATRAVVVLSDGEDNKSEGCLDDIVEMGPSMTPSAPSSTAPSTTRRTRRWPSPRTRTARASPLRMSSVSS